MDPGYGGSRAMGQGEDDEADEGYQIMMFLMVMVVLVVMVMLMVMVIVDNKRDCLDPGLGGSRAMGQGGDDDDNKDYQIMVFLMVIP